MIVCAIEDLLFSIKISTAAKQLGVAGEEEELAQTSSTSVGRVVVVAAVILVVAALAWWLWGRSG